MKEEGKRCSLGPGDLVAQLCKFGNDVGGSCLITLAAKRARAERKCALQHREIVTFGSMGTSLANWLLTSISMQLPPTSFPNLQNAFSGCSIDVQ